MPPRLFDLPTKRWSTLDLPILPFLAPRVFKPWPCWASKVHSGTPKSSTSTATERNTGGSSRHRPQIRQSSIRGYASEAYSKQDKALPLDHHKPLRLRRLTGHIRGLDRRRKEDESATQKLQNTLESSSLKRYLRLNNSPLLSVAKLEVNSEHDSPLSDHLSEDAIRISLERWEAIPNDMREELWPEIMIEAMKNNPIVILRLLDAGYLASSSSTQVVEDSMASLLSHLRHNEPFYRPEYIVQLYTSIHRLMHQYPVRISQLSIHTMVTRLPVGVLSK